MSRPTIRVAALGLAAALLVGVAGCGDDTGPDQAGTTQQDASGIVDGGDGVTAVRPSEDISTAKPPDVGAGGGTATVDPPCGVAEGDSDGAVSAPLLVDTLTGTGEAWLGSPAIADLDGDGGNEIIVPRYGTMLAYGADGSVRWSYEAGGGRIWASAVVADFRGDAALEVVFAERERVHMVDASGAAVPGFPVTWEDEIRSIAAGDLDGDGRPEIVAAAFADGGDVVNAWRADGTPVGGFPPVGSGTSGCDADGLCHLAGAFDQNVAVGDLDGDAGADIVVPMDNAYVSIHHGDGVAFDAADGYAPLKTPGVRYLHDLELARQGYADDEAVDLQAHFTNTPPAIADIDGDGTNEVIMVGSVQNAGQDDREQGVALWAVHGDAGRLPGFESPVHVPGYLGGLWDFEGTNVVGLTNQVTVADVSTAQPGLELVFAGYDGQIHAVASDGRPLWSHTYATRADVLTGGVLAADLSGDGSPEILFATYSPESGVSALSILDADGALLHEVPLPGRGAMPVPTLGDLDGDGQLELVVSLKDGADGVQIYTIPGSAGNCLLWPTGRANLARNGSVVD